MLTTRALGAGGRLLERLPGFPPRVPLGQIGERRARYWPFVLILLGAFAIRFPDFGNPHVDNDEPFYLLVGDRMLQGALPYVDIWDRKPIGLFLIYAAARLLGGEGFLQYQVIATLFAAATGWFVFLMARRWTSTLSAVGCAILYVIYLGLFFVGGGQSEVFFGLLTAASAWLGLRALRLNQPQTVFIYACIAMLLCGLALQIKYTVLPQCVFFGCFFLLRIYWDQRSLPKLFSNALLFVSIGLAPTLVAAAYYAAVGELEAFVQANLFSIFLRGSLTREMVESTGFYVIVALLPMAAAAVAGVVIYVRAVVDKQDLIFLLGWLATTFVGSVMVGNLYIHYFAPVLLPLVLLCAPLFSARLGLTWFVALLVFAAAGSGYPGIAESQSRRAALARITETVRPHIQGSFVYAYDGPSAIYLTTNTLPPTAFVYPDHLNNAMEQDALGADTGAEVRRILAARPGAILIAERPVVPRWNPETHRLVRDALKLHYVQVDSVPVLGRFIHVFVRRPPPPLRAWPGRGSGSAEAR